MKKSNPVKNNIEYPETISQEDFERIDRYVKNLMDPKEKSSFEIELTQQPQLKNEVELHRKLIASLEVNTFIREKEYSTSNSLKPAPFKNIVSFRRVWLAAASVIIILTAAALWFILSPSKNDRLYSSYYSIDPGMPTNMGAEEEYEFNRGMVDYKTGEYEQAISRWEKLYAEDSLNSELNYFLGVAWLNLENVPKSAHYLDKVSPDTLSPFRQSAIWYLALANIKMNNNQKAAILLKSIPEYPAAPQLLKDLENHK